LPIFKPGVFNEDEKEKERGTMLSEKESRGNVIVVFGGGLVNPAKFIVMGIARSLKRWADFEKVFTGLYSFESLYTRELWLEYSEELEEYTKDKRGSFFGTCRGIDLTQEPLKSRMLETLKGEKISTVVVVGGDGSTRNAAEIDEFLQENGICVVYGMPLTVDGINGGKVIGRRQAARESIRQIENIASASLQTRDSEKYGVVIVELQGRNRDDILARVVSYFHERKEIADFRLDDILLIAIPATLKTNSEDLLETVKNSEKRTLILLSEGASTKVDKLAWLIQEYGETTRKVRVLVVGHPSQCNNQTTPDDRIEYGRWIDFVVKAILENPGKSFSTSLSEEGEYSVRPLDYYAKLNPRSIQIAELPPEEVEIVRHYMVL